MEKVIHICDVCGNEETYESQYKSEYRKSVLVVGKKGSIYVTLDPYNCSFKKDLLVCPECQKKLGIAPEDDIEHAGVEKAQDIKSKLFEAFTEIADELGYVRA